MTKRQSTRPIWFADELRLTAQQAGPNDIRGWCLFDEYDRSVLIHNLHRSVIPPVCSRILDRPEHIRVPIQTTIATQAESWVVAVISAEQEPVSEQCQRQPRTRSKLECFSRFSSSGDLSIKYHPLRRSSCHLQATRSLNPAHCISHW